MHQIPQQQAHHGQVLQHQLPQQQVLQHQLPQQQVYILLLLILFKE